EGERGVAVARRGRPEAVWTGQQATPGARYGRDGWLFLARGTVSTAGYSARPARSRHQATPRAWHGRDGRLLRACGTDSTTLLLERGDVAGVEAQLLRLQQPPHDLAAARLRELRHALDGGGRGDRPQLVA